MYWKNEKGVSMLEIIMVMIVIIILMMLFASMLGEAIEVKETKGATITQQQFKKSNE